MDEKNFSLLHTYSKISEYHAIKQMLEQEGIEIFVRSFQDTAYDDIYKPQYGMGRIYVRKNDLPAAKKLIEDFLKS
jgi:hypothetical protein